MDVFLMVRRKKSTLFVDAKETTSVLELKRIVEGIVKKPPNQQRLYAKDDVVRGWHDQRINTMFGRLPQLRTTICVQPPYF
jgi:hypothetical protein